MALDRDAFLSRDDLPREEVAISDSGDSVFVRTMTGSERDRFEAAHLASPSKDVRARLAVHTVCDADGNLLFTEADIPAVGAKSAAVLDRIFAAALRLNGIGKQDVEALRGNSPAGR